MTTTQTIYLPTVIQPTCDVFGLRQVMAGFLAGFGSLTREAYQLDLRHRTAGFGGSWLVTAGAEFRE